MAVPVEERHGFPVESAGDDGFAGIVSVGHLEILQMDLVGGISDRVDVKARKVVTMKVPRVTVGGEVGRDGLVVVVDASIHVRFARGVVGGADADGVVLDVGGHPSLPANRVPKVVA